MPVSKKQQRFLLAIDTHLTGPDPTAHYCIAIGAALICVGSESVQERFVVILKPPNEIRNEWDHETIKTFWKSSKNRVFYDWLRSDAVQEASVTREDARDLFTNWLEIQMQRYGSDRMLLVFDTPGKDYMALAELGLSPDHIFGKFQRACDLTSFYGGIKRRLPFEPSWGYEDSVFKSLGLDKKLLYRQETRSPDDGAIAMALNAAKVFNTLQRQKHYRKKSSNKRLTQSAPELPRVEVLEQVPVEIPKVLTPVIMHAPRHCYAFYAFFVFCFLCTVSTLFFQ